MRSLLFVCRVGFVVLIGNITGYLAWKASLILIQRLWMVSNSPNNFFVGALAVLSSFFLFTVPYVLIGMLGARFVSQWQMFIGSACGLWVFTVTPATFTILPVVAYYHPILPVLFLGTLGGWLITPPELRPPLRRKR